MSSTRDVTFLCNMLLATTVKFFVSVHFAFCMLYFVHTEVFEVSTVSDFNNIVPSNHDTFDKGLLKISRLNSIVSVSFTTITSLISINGLSVGKMKVDI